MGKKVRILVCGSAGFLMSNFIRYILYRSKHYEIISVDKLKDHEDARRMYIHRNHTFFIGDIADSEFMHRVLQFYPKPDIIVNGVNPVSRSGTNLSEKQQVKTIIQGALNLQSNNIPIIQLVPSIWESDPLGFWNSAAMITNKGNGTVLELPNCYGMRGTAENNDVCNIIKKVTNEQEVEVYDKPIPWTYVEDVASMIWYLIEQHIYGKNVPGHIKMPVSGIISHTNIANLVGKLLEKPVKLNINNVLIPSCSAFESDNIEGWASDYQGTEFTLTKTIKWYAANKWALSY